MRPSESEPDQVTLSQSKWDPLPPQPPYQPQAGLIGTLGYTLGYTHALPVLMFTVCVLVFELCFGGFGFLGVDRNCVC